LKGISCGVESIFVERRRKARSVSQSRSGIGVGAGGRR